MLSLEYGVSCGCPGDVLLSINGVDLTQLTYGEAVSVLKAQTAQPSVALRVIRTLAEEDEEEGDAAAKEEQEGGDSPREDDIHWAPLWTRWLGLPRWDTELQFLTSTFRQQQQQQQRIVI